MRHARRSTDITQCYPEKKTERKVVAKTRHQRQAQKPKKVSEMSSDYTPRGNKQQQHHKAPRTELDYEIERLKAEIQQEIQMK